jgi:hypothetical protein
MTHRTRLSIVALAAIFLSSALALHLRAADDKETGQSKDQPDEQLAGASSSSGRFFEMRTYHTADGKLEALHNRFPQHTNRLFKKHGIEMIGYWTPADAPASKNTLVFLLAYPNREARDKSWQAFTNDPEWKKAAADSERDGKLVTKVDQLFMNPTDYSPIK